MSTPLPVAFRASPLPSNFRGTPQDLLDAFVARLSMETEEDLALYVAGSVTPTSDSGPWLKDGLTWWVWDVDIGDYKPQPLDSLSLRYVIQEGEPSNVSYDIWIQTNSDGKAIAIKTYSDGAWRDVYETKFTEIDDAIEAAGNAYPVAVENTVSQLITIDGEYHLIEFNSAYINPGSNWDNATYKYTVPADGYYFITAEVQVDNYSGDAATLEFGMYATVNGFPTPCASGASVPTPSGQRWYPQISGMIEAHTGDLIDIRLECNDNSNTGVVGVSNGSVAIHKVNSV